MGCFNSKRASHTETALSFVIFISFLFFLLVIIDKDIRTKDIKLVLLDSLNQKLLDRFSEEVIVVDVYSESGCVKMDGGKFNALGLNSIAKDRDGNVLDANLEGDDLNVLEEGDFLVYYSSKKFIESDVSTDSPCTEPKDVFVTSYSFFIDDFLLDFKERYSTDYMGLKRELGIFSTEDFGVVFEYEDGRIIEIGEEYGKVAYLKDVPVLYLDENANVKRGFLRAKIWGS